MQDIRLTLQQKNSLSPFKTGKLKNVILQIAVKCVQKTAGTFENLNEDVSKVWAARFTGQPLLSPQVPGSNPCSHQQLLLNISLVLTLTN